MQNHKHICAHNGCVPCPVPCPSSWGRRGHPQVRTPAPLHQRAWHRWAWGRRRQGLPHLPPPSHSCSPPHPRPHLYSDTHPVHTAQSTHDRRAHSRPRRLQGRRIPVHMGSPSACTPPPPFLPRTLGGGSSCSSSSRGGGSGRAGGGGRRSSGVVGVRGVLQHIPHTANMGLGGAGVVWHPHNTDDVTIFQAVLREGNKHGKHLQCTGARGKQSASGCDVSERNGEQQRNMSPLLGNPSPPHHVQPCSHRSSQPRQSPTNPPTY
jgi:hypothetical protein